MGIRAQHPRLVPVMKLLSCTCCGHSPGFSPCSFSLLSQGLLRMPISGRRPLVHLSYSPHRLCFVNVFPIRYLECEPGSISRLFTKGRRD